MVNNSGSTRKILLATLALLALFSVCIRPAFAALTDTTPPVLTSFDFTPKSVDVTNGAGTVTVNLHVTDDLSGFSYAYVYFTSPSHGQTQSVYIYNLTSGTPLDGDAQGILTIPQFSEAGNWVVSYVSLGDRAGNYQTIDTTALSSMGFPTTLSVISPGQDVTPPQLNSFALAPAFIDVSSGPQSITFTMEISDSPAGVACTQSYCNIGISVRSPSGKQTQSDGGSNVTQLSGTLQTGFWQVLVTLPRYAEAGLWHVNYLYL